MKKACNNSTKKIEFRMIIYIVLLDLSALYANIDWTRSSTQFQTR